MPVTDDITQSRGAVCRLLAILWAKELTTPTLQLLASPDVQDLWTTLGGTVPSEEQLDDLAETYCRLFIGPAGHLPPIQSVWTDGELQSNVVASLQEFAACCDYESPWSGLLPDHLGNALQLMGLLLAKAGLEDQADRIEVAADLTAAFHGQHLTWAVPYTEKVAQADDGFYGRLAAITADFLRLEEKNVSSVAVE